MQQALQYSAYAIGLWLNVQVISALMRGSYRQYPFVLAYALTLLASTVVEIALRSAPKALWDGYYWADEAILDVLVFCVVIAFIDHAARYSKQKLIERHWLVLAAAVICAISFALHHSLPMNRQMTLISRDLNICAVILDLILWSLLVTARRPDRRLLLLSGGLGLQLSGAIMGEQLRHFSHSLFLTGTLLEVTTGLLALYIWGRALRTVPAPESAPA
ncbi:MAG: hypothetical protein ABSG65_00790 [Bryobacteraceae bacterium]|jgi:hypothetical protein